MEASTYRMASGKIEKNGEFTGMRTICEHCWED